ncbi:MAG: MarR family winged helix-turn-helix transcriptional regulator [Candidatus Limnocylindria bacterium]
MKAAETLENRTTLGQQLIGSATHGRLAPEAEGGQAWVGFLRSHAAVLRLLDTELRLEAGLSLVDFDVLIQLALAEGGELRMTDLARRTLVSRSGMTRRVAELEREGLVTRCSATGDGRSVRASLTPTGEEVLRRAVPVHMRGIERHFLDRLTSEQLSALRGAVSALQVECDFG